MRTESVSLIGALVVALTACGNGTGSESGLSGQWVYSTSNLRSGGVTCSSDATRLSLTQNGTGFSGTYNGGMMVCTNESGTARYSMGTGRVIGGNITGDQVAFNLDSNSWHNTGTMSGGRMSGTTTAYVVVNGATLVVSGAWEAVRP